MVKKVAWVGIAAIWLASGLVAFFISNAEPVLAGHEDLDQPVGPSQIQQLQDLELEFGDSQNSLILTLKDGQTDPQIVFLLNEIETRSTLRSRQGGQSSRGRGTFVRHIFADYATSVTAADLNVSYNLRAPGSGLSLPSHCRHEPLITLDAGEVVDQPEKDGYSQDWKNYDFAGKRLRASVSLPIYDAATTNIQDDCFVLETSLEVEAASNLPAFSLIGGYSNLELTCSGLNILGRGGDDWQNAATVWSCRDDLDLPDDANDAYAVIEQPPFSNSLIFIEDRDDKCGGRLLINRQNLESGAALIEGQWQDWHDDCKKGQYKDDKDKKRVESVRVVNAGIQSQADGQPSNLPLGPTQSVVPDHDNQNCDLQLSGVGFGYAVCWLLRGTSGILHYMESVIYSQLTVERSDYQNQFSSNSQAFSYKDAWRNMRDFATYSIIGTALFMIISTALDAGLFKNYTVKKYLPRLVAGTILIQFSWVLGDFLIQSFTQLGDLLSALLFASFPGAEEHGLEEIFGSGGVSSLLGAGITAAGIWAGWATLLPALTAGAIMLAIGFLFLIARKYLIIFLLILSPLGLALWILPGNDKAWNFYAKMFFYLVALYPIIALTIAAGKIFSYIIML